MEDSKKLLSPAQISDLHNGHSTQFVANKLSSHHKRLFGAIFGMLEIISEYDKENIHSIVTLFSSILFNDLQSSTTSSTSHFKLFQKFAVQSQDLFPYHLTFCHRVGKAPCKDPKNIWNNIIQSSSGMDDSGVLVLDSSTEFKVIDLDNSFDDYDLNPGQRTSPVNRSKPKRRGFNSETDADSDLDRSILNLSAGVNTYLFIHIL
jgi:hypothetical protein